jgi:hypothetical protein
MFLLIVARFRTETPDPNLVAALTESEDPNVQLSRTESLLPNLAVQRTLNAEPRFTCWITLSQEPHLPDDLKERLDPKLMSAKMEQLALKSARDRRLIPEPSLQTARSDKLLPRLV